MMKGVFLSLVVLRGIEGQVFVTPYLEENNITGGQEATKVDGVGGMYAGFITIEASTNSNTYFVFSEALNGNTEAPILIWLQGGPGASSLFGLFTEIGPIEVNENIEISSREINWNQEYHLLFLDNPLGTGFSFTESEERMATNQDQIGTDLKEAVRQFYLLFPEYKENELYVTGESYAGKYVPSLGYALATSNDTFCNFKGVSIGDGAFDPYHQFNDFANLLYYMGLVDYNEKLVIANYTEQWQAAMDINDTVAAFRVFDEMLNGDEFPYDTYYANVTGMATNYFNFQESPDADSLSSGYFIEYLGTDAGRAAFNVGDRNFSVENNTVETKLLEDWMLGVVPKLQTLLNESYKVLIYSGQNDVILGAPLTENALRVLEWTGQKDFLQAEKKVWTYDDDVAGYIRNVENFTYAVFRDAGHMVPTDQPSRALALITNFVSGSPLNFTSASVSFDSPSSPPRFLLRRRSPSSLSA